MNEEKLIVEVKQKRSIIYDSLHRFYMYNYRKEIAF